MRGKICFQKVDRISYHLFIVNTKNLDKDYVHGSNSKTPLAKIKKSRFQRTNSIEITDDASTKIPLSSSVKVVESSNRNFKGNYSMYPNTLLKPVKFSIPKRMPSSNRNEKELKSSVAIVKEEIEKKDNQNNGPDNRLLNKKASLSEIDNNTKIERRGRKKKNSSDKNDMKNGQKLNNPINSFSEEIKSQNKSKEESIHETKTECVSKIAIENQNGFNDIQIDQNAKAKEVSINPQISDNQSKITFNNNQFKSKSVYPIARSMSARNPNANTNLASSSNLLLSKKVHHFLAKKRTFFGEENQISRTTSKPLNSSNLPKNPFEYVANRPVPILSQYRNSQFNTKLLKTTQDFAYSHSDDEARDIYEAMKPHIKLINSRKSFKFEPTKNNIIDLKSNDHSDNVTNINTSIKEEGSQKQEFSPSTCQNILNHNSNFINVQNIINEHESRLKSKVKPKHAYGEQTKDGIENYLKSRIVWKLHPSDENDKQIESGSVYSLPTSCINNSEQAKSILKKLETKLSDNPIKNTDEIRFYKEDKEVKENKQFIPPFFREHQNVSNHEIVENVKIDDKKKKDKKSKPKIALDTETLNHMQEVTRQYGIFDEAFRPFVFSKDKKKTSTSADAITQEFNQADDFFEFDDDDQLFYF